MKNKLILMGILVLTFVGCDATKKSQENIDLDMSKSSEIINTIWELSVLENNTINQTDENRQKIQFTLNPVDKTVSGFSGCNLFHGKYTLEDGNRLKFSALGSTKMACQDPIVNETNFLKALELVDNYTLQNDILSLNVGRRAPLATFKKVSSEDLIVGKYWKLKTLEGKDIKMAENQDREIFFTLEAHENRITGFAGCNRISGEYIIEKGNRISFKNIATTLKACPDFDGNETEFLNVFNLANNYTINGDILSLNVGKRAPLAMFEAVYMQ